MNHVHVSFMSFLIVWLYIFVGSFLLKAWAMAHPDSKLAKGLAVTVL